MLHRVLTRQKKEKCLCQACDVFFRIGLCLATTQKTPLRSVRRYAALFPLRLAACHPFRSKGPSRIWSAGHGGHFPCHSTLLGKQATGTNLFGGIAKHHWCRVDL